MTPLIVNDDGTQMLVTQQAAARLEPHPVLGRLQLQPTTLPSPTAAANAPLMPPFKPSEKQIYLSLPRSTTNTGRVDAEHRPSKKRLVWTPELHERFVRAIDMIGLNHAVPKTLVTIMNVEGLTTEHVKSHLQKYRNSLRKEAAEEAKERGNSLPLSINPRITSTPSTASAVNSHVETLVQHTVVATNTQIGMQHLPILPNRISVLGALPLPQVANLQQALAPATVVSPKSTDTAVHSPISKRASQLRCSPVPTVVTTSTAMTTANMNVTPVMPPLQVSPAMTTPVSSGMVDSIPLSVMEHEMACKEVVQEAVQEADMNRPAEIVTAPMSTVSTVVMTGAESRVKQEICVVDAPGAENGAGDIKANGKTAKECAPERDLELELMKEKTLQMQLQLQMVLHRTIALEKKLEERHSERVNAEATGADVAAIGQDVMNDDDSRGEKEKSGVGEESEVKALLDMQVGLRKQLEETKALLNQQISGDVKGGLHVITNVRNVGKVIADNVEENNDMTEAAGRGKKAKQVDVS